MRAWYFHPLIFYPLVAAIAALVIGFSLRPQSWPRSPAPVAGATSGESLVLEGAAFDAPDPGADQYVTVVRDFWGRARALRIALLPGKPPPTPADRGVRLLLTAERTTALSGRPVVVHVAYAPLPVNAADGVAVSLQGSQPTQWVSQPAPPQNGVLSFELPAQSAPTAIGLRALSGGSDQAYGIEITAVRITPREIVAPGQ